MAFRVTPYDFTIRHEAGKSNVAYFISRQPIDDVGTGEFEAISKEYVNCIAWSSLPNAISQQEIIEESKKENPIDY
jgi:hypothetical protein